MAGDGVIRESRPVRKVMSRAKRAEITENFEEAAGSDEARFDFDALPDNKVRVSGVPRGWRRRKQALCSFDVHYDRKPAVLIVVFAVYVNRARQTSRACRRCYRPTSCSRT
jgi:hypothetical protein